MAEALGPQGELALLQTAQSLASPSLNTHSKHSMLGAVHATGTRQSHSCS